MRLFRLLLCLLIIVVAASKVQAQDSVFVAQLHTSNGINTWTRGSSLSFLPAATKDSATALPVINRLPLNYYSTHLGAACKMELRLEKQTGLPIRIRLGSKEQVDYLEGKFSRKQ